MEKLIRIYTSSKGPLQKVVLSGFYEKLSSVSDLDIREYVANGRNEDLLRVWINKISIEDTELIVAVGEWATSVIVKELSSRKFPIPVLYVAVNERNIPQLNSDFITGVYSECVQDHIPMQMFFRLYPNAEKLLAPYRTAARFGRASYEVQRLQRYCKERKVELTPLALDQASEAEIVEHVAQCDAVLMLEGCFIASDSELIKQQCKAADKPYIGDGEGALKRGGMYGFKEDFRFMGAKAGEFAEKIVCHDVVPSDITPYQVRNSRYSFATDSTEQSSGGVFMADDVVAALEGNMTAHRDQPTYRIACSMIMETAFSLGKLFCLSAATTKAD